jgi:hypothetical protein
METEKEAAQLTFVGSRRRLQRLSVADMIRFEPNKFFELAPLNTATSIGRFAGSKTRSDGREALRTRGDYIKAA